MSRDEHEHHENTRFWATMVNLDIEELPTKSALGLKWNTEDDSFVWDVAEKLSRFPNTQPVTRRDLGSAVYSLFDPRGFIAPYLMKAKLLLQILVRKGVGWDDPLEEDEREQWRRWLEDLPAVFGDTVETQVHFFYDASRSGYSAVAFLRLTESDKQVYSAFVMGKAKLGHIREISIPRLELTAAVVSVKHLRDRKNYLLDRLSSKVYYNNNGRQPSGSYTQRVGDQ